MAIKPVGGGFGGRTINDLLLVAGVGVVCTAVGMGAVFLWDHGWLGGSSSAVTRSDIQQAVEQGVERYVSTHPSVAQMQPAPQRTGEPMQLGCEPVRIKVPVAPPGVGYWVTMSDQTRRPGYLNEAFSCNQASKPHPDTDSVSVHVATDGDGWATVGVPPRRKRQTNITFALTRDGGLIAWWTQPLGDRVDVVMVPQPPIAVRYHGPV